jgi:hypothetical protein
VTRPLFPNVEVLLTPQTLSELTGHVITAVCARPIQPKYAKSGSRIVVVETNDGSGPCYILKRVARAWDWQMRATDDFNCRTVTLWQRGLFDRMPPELDHAMLACARDGEGWAILMEDVEATLCPYCPFSLDEHARYVEAIAAVHAAFWESPEVRDPALGLCTLRHVYSIFSPATGQREAGGDEEVPRRILEGWERFPEVVERDVADVVLRLVADPTPLCAALARHPHTLVHGDWRHANQGLREKNGQMRVILLDWQMAAVAPPAVELGRFLGTNSPLLPASKEATLALYRDFLERRLGARLSAEGWRPQLELGLLGGFVQDGWAIALKATTWAIGADYREHWRADLRWWSERVREGMKWL